MRQQELYGYTLIEMAIVLAIIVVVSVQVLPSLKPNPRAEADREIARLGERLRMAAAVARWSGATLGWMSDGTHYSFLRADAAGVWHEIAGDARFPPCHLPDGLRVVGLELDGQSLSLAEPLPFTAGNAPLYRVSLRDADRLHYLEGLPDGTVERTASPAS